MNRGGLTARFTCICIWPNVYDGTRGAHVGHFRSGAGDRHDHLMITMDTVVHFGLEFLLFPRRLWKEMETRPQRHGSRARADGCGAGRQPGLHHPSPTVWSTTSPQSGLSGSGLSGSCSPSARARDALLFSVAFIRTTLYPGVSQGGCPAVPERYLYHLDAAWSAPARVRSRQPQSQ